MMKIDEILENYPELDSSRKAELKEEILGLFSVSNQRELLLSWKKYESDRLWLQDMTDEEQVDSFLKQ